MLSNEIISFGLINITKIGNNSCAIANSSRHGKPMSTGFLSFVAVYYILVIILGIIGNGLIVAAFLKGPKLRRVTVNMIMVHMAIVNLIHVCISNPFALIKNYNPDLIENKMVNCVLAMSFWMCFTISLYSLVAISINRYLLIAHPTTTFRRFCTGRAIGLVLVLIWLFAFMLHFSLWVQLVLSSRSKYNHEHEGKCNLHRHRITSLELVVIYSFVIFVPPLVVIPLMHSLTLYTMRSSTRRVQRATEADMHGRNLRDLRDQSKTPSGSILDMNIPLSTGTSGLHYCRSGGDMLTTCQLANLSLRAAAIVITPPAASSSNDLEQDGKSPRKKHKKCRGVFCACRTETELDENAHMGPKRPRLGHHRGELRLIRLMMSVYAILVVVWIPTLILMTDIFDITELQIHGLIRLGLLYPLFPSLVPYVYLWSNRNFQRTLRRSLKRKTSSKIYKPAHQQK